jgi:hypothetical protein
VKIGVRLGAIVLIGTLAAGCAAETKNARTLQESLVSIGVTPTAAKCVVDGMSNTFGDRRLGAHEVPTADEIRAQKALLRKCEVKVKKS